MKHTKNLPATSPLVMMLQLNMAVYHAEIKKDLNTAIETLEHVLSKTFENVNVFALDGAESIELKRVINLMRKNM